MSDRNDIALSVRGLSKAYTIAHNNTEKHSTLAETLLHRLRRPFAKAETETFWALKDVSFDINKGDVVGIIGRNGAGKSTLLKILSRITEPTTGEIDVYGRIGSLLEVGTGFHPELTGRENVYLNGQILGMRKKEIDKQFDAIVDFSGVEKFLDTPVKRYSSGMYVRLAFAVAAHLESEILIVDEVLAVGDAEFQKKCLGKMKDLSTTGRTVLFVSHHMQAIASLCNVAIHLSGGRLDFSGEATECIVKYIQSYKAAGLIENRIAERRPGTGEVRIVAVTSSKEIFGCNERKHFSVRIRRKSQYSETLHLIILIKNDQDIILVHLDSRLLRRSFTLDSECEIDVSFETPWLKPGSYRVDGIVCGSSAVDVFTDACRFDIGPVLPYLDGSNLHATQTGLVFSDFAMEVRLRHCVVV